MVTKRVSSICRTIHIARDPQYMRDTTHIRTVLQWEKPGQRGLAHRIFSMIAHEDTCKSQSTRQQRGIKLALYPPTTSIIPNTAHYTRLSVSPPSSNTNKTVNRNKISIFPLVSKLLLFATQYEWEDETEACGWWIIFLPMMFPGRYEHQGSKWSIMMWQLIW